MQVALVEDTQKARANSPHNLLYIPETFMRKSYFFPPEEFDPPPTSAYGIIINNIDPNTKILDVGCGHGYLGEYLHQMKNCRVYGLEIDKEAVCYVKNRGVYEDITLLNIDDLSDNISTLTTNSYLDFDAVICADILEHTKNINNIILSLFKLLKPGGYLFVSMPNINHIDIVYNLIRGKFNYAPFGILDNSHLRFFTKKSFVEWLSILANDNNIQIRIELLGQTRSIQILETEEEIKSNINAILETLLSLYKEIGDLSDSFVMQNIFKIRFL